ncbi:MAG TPA: trypsin-like peptidase domain-containing protein [Aquihabitans sp.]|nr:trypsin-like peptidase domain-containing protein [Aquihabitans sp.]
MTDERHDPSPSPWSPSAPRWPGSPTGAPSARPDAPPMPPTGAPTWSSPAAGGAGEPPRTPPPLPVAPPSPSAGGPAAGPSPSATPPRRRGRAGLAALAVVATFAAGAAGVAVGRETVDDGSLTTSDAGAAPGRPVSTVPGPVDADAEEPAAAVAAALAPAVVQIETGSGLGSGFIYDASGLVLTAAHVLGDSDQVEVRLADGSRRTGEVLGSDDSTDVAVVRIDADEDLPVAVLATGVDLEVGQTAVAIGSPFGLDQTVTAGIVSAVGRSTQTPGGVIPAIQTDAPINSGNSGGALADRQGRVIGINDSIITGSRQASGNVGVGFAIPIDIAKEVADKIVAGESTEAGYLGVGGADATGDRVGAAITSVEPGSPAADAGLTEDDVVTQVDGSKVSSMIDLAAAVRTKAPGEQVVLTVVRDGDERTVEVTLGAAQRAGR